MSAFKTSITVLIMHNVPIPMDRLTAHVHLDTKEKEPNPTIVHVRKIISDRVGGTCVPSKKGGVSSCLFYPDKEDIANKAHINSIRHLRWNVSFVFAKLN